jgi:hypothetical protein
VWHMQTFAERMKNESVARAIMVIAANLTPFAKQCLVDLQVGIVSCSGSRPAGLNRVTFCLPVPHSFSDSIPDRITPLAFIALPAVLVVQLDNGNSKAVTQTRRLQGYLLSSSPRMSSSSTSPSMCWSQSTGWKSLAWLADLLNVLVQFQARAAVSCLSICHILQMTRWGHVHLLWRLSA